jgi:hypothetical protein
MLQLVETMRLTGIGNAPGYRRLSMVQRNNLHIVETPLLRKTGGLFSGVPHFSSAV